MHSTLNVYCISKVCKKAGRWSGRLDSTTQYSNLCRGKLLTMFDTAKIKLSTLYYEWFTYKSTSHNSHNNMADKLKEINQFNVHRTKYLGLGTPDTTREQFISNIKRDTYASLAQHDPILVYTSVALNEHPSVLRQAFLKKMVQPLKPALSNDTS